MRAASRGVAALAAAAAAAALGCAAAEGPSLVPFTPTRFDYEAFRAEHEDLVEEPNYLPFMAHRVQAKGKKQDWLVFCRWSEDRFPLSVWIHPPRIHPELWNEFKVQDPSIFVDAAWRALETWQREVGPPIAFRRATAMTDADIRVELIGERGPAPEEGVQVLGATPLQRACRVRGKSALDPSRLEVNYVAPLVRAYVADEHGVLPPDQVERNVLHEMGHALGMRSHSPIPADLMYEVARDRRVSTLSREDVRSFRSLYRIPNGTLYATVPRGTSPSRRPAAAPAGEPVLSDSSYTDPRLGFALRAPAGWRIVPAKRGVVVIDGLAWDYEGSFQVIVHHFATVASYVRRHGGGHLRDGQLMDQRPLVVAGRPALRMIVAQQGGAMIEQHTFIETGDGRVVVLIAESPAELRAGFAPWFDAVQRSLEILPLEDAAPAKRSAGGTNATRRR